LAPISGSHGALSAGSRSRRQYRRGLLVDRCRSGLRSGGGKAAEPNSAVEWPPAWWPTSGTRERPSGLRGRYSPQATAHARDIAWCLGRLVALLEGARAHLSRRRARDPTSFSVVSRNATTGSDGMGSHGYSRASHELRLSAPRRGERVPEESGHHQAIRRCRTLAYVHVVPAGNPIPGDTDSRPWMRM
jgi:hypothetical protein